VQRCGAVCRCRKVVQTLRCRCRLFDFGAGLHEKGFDLSYMGGFYVSLKIVYKIFICFAKHKYEVSYE